MAQKEANGMLSLRVPRHTYEALASLRQKLEADLSRIPGHKPAFYRLALHDAVQFLIDVSGDEIAIVAEGRGSQVVRDKVKHFPPDGFGQMTLRAYDNGEQMEP